jgi:hypothetical protein
MKLNNGSPWIWFLLEEVLTVQGKGKGKGKVTGKDKGRETPVHAWTGSDGSKILSLSYFKTFSTWRW